MYSICDMTENVAVCNNAGQHFGIPRAAIGANVGVAFQCHAVVAEPNMTDRLISTRTAEAEAQEPVMVLAVPVVCFPVML